MCIRDRPDTGAYVSYSSALKRLAIKLSKICNDLRLMASGPRCGFNEINLPPKAPGSSIMPGKVNPVIPEVTNQVCFKVIGNDATICFAAEDVYKRQPDNTAKSSCQTSRLYSCFLSLLVISQNKTFYLKENYLP